MTAPKIDTKRQKAPVTFTALQMCQEYVCDFHISTTLNKNLDKMLNNEVSPGLITEFVGLPGSGKSQICYYLMSAIQLYLCNKKIDSEIVFVGTCNDFASHRLREIIEILMEKHKYSFSTDEIMENINFIEIEDCLELQALIKYLEIWLPTRKKVTLLIIDSISLPLKRISSEKKVKIMYQIMRSIQKLANLYNFPIVVTNDLTTKKSGSKMYVTPLFGDTFYHCVNSRIFLTKTNEGFNAKVQKSVISEVGSVDFNL